MSTTVFPSTPAQNLAFLCGQLPDHFRLAGVRTGQRQDHQGQTPFEFQWLEVNWGPAWLTSAVALNLDTGVVEIADNDNLGAVFQAASSYCRGSHVLLVLTVDPEREWHRTCAVTLSNPHERQAQHLGLGSTLDLAALDALITALTAWQVGSVSPQRGWA